MEWYWWLAWGAAIGWLTYRLFGQVLVNIAAKRWFGKPEPGSIRLFGRGKLRPIQRLDSLQVPFMRIGNEFLPFNNDETKHFRHGSEWAALGDGLVVGALAYRAAAASSEQAHSVLAELPVALDRIELNSDPNQFLTEAQRVGYESWVQGHIGESVAANVLTQHGHHVEFAELPNQPGWDLIVDGVPMNVKVGETAAVNIAEHFERYPEIPVVTDVHTAASLDHPEVYGVPNLEPDHIEQLSAAITGEHSTPVLHDAPWDTESGLQLDGASEVGESLTEGAEGAAESGGGIMDVGVPWITIGTSVVREDRLAEKYGGDTLESVGAIAADAAGVGIGAKVGAAVGLAFGPIGAVLCAIGGALLGKSAVNSARRNNVEAEIKKLKPKLQELAKAFRFAKQRFEVESQQVITLWNERLEESTRPHRTTFQNFITALSQEHDSATLAFLDSIYQLFDVFEKWLNLDMEEVRRRFPARHPIWRLLLPSEADAARDLAAAWIVAKRAELQNWRDRFARFAAERELTGSMDIKAARQLMVDFFGKYRVWDAEVAPILKQSVLRFDDLAKKATIAHKNVMLRILEEFKRCEGSARKELSAMWKAYEDEIKSMAQNLDEELRDLARQAARAGVQTIPSPLETLAQKSSKVKRGIGRATSKSKRLANLPLLKGMA